MQAAQKNNVQANDQTILAGLGVSSDFDFTLTNFHIKEPNATSTACPSNSRQDFLDAICNRKDDNEYLTISSQVMYPNIKFTNSGRRDHENKGQSRTDNKLPTSKGAVDFTELNHPKSNVHIVRDNHSSIEPSHSHSENDISLLPGSSILDETKFHSLSYENEIDLKKGCRSIYNIPSILLRKSNKENQEPSLADVWATFNDPDKKGRGTFLVSPKTTEHLQKDTIDTSYLYARPKHNARDCFYSSYLSIANSFGGHKIDHEDKFNKSWTSQVNCSFTAFPEASSSMAGESFDTPHLSMFSEAGKEALSDERFKIDDNLLVSENCHRDLSGFTDAKDIPSRFLHWSGLEKDLKDEGNLCIEDIFKAKSCKLGSPTGRGKEKPSFGFPAEDIESPPKYVPAETSPVKLQTNSSNNSSTYFGHKEQKKRNSTLKETEADAKSSCFNRSSLSFTVCGEDPVDRASNSDSGISDNLKEDAMEQEIYIEMLRKLIEKAKAEGSHEQLMKEILRCPHPNVSSIHLLEDMSHANDESYDVLELRHYREMLQSKIFANPGNSNIPKGSSTSGKMSSYPSTDDISHPEELTDVTDTSKGTTIKKRPARMKMGTSAFKKLPETSKTTSDYPLIHDDGDVNKGNAVRSTHRLSGVKTKADFPGENLTSKTSVLSVKKADVDVFCEGTRILDFGLVPECCLVQKEVTFINNSSYPLPVFICLKQLSSPFEDALSWAPNQDHLRLMSNSRAACELPASSSIKAVATFKAPAFGLNNETDKMMFEIEAFLMVLFDCPSKTTSSVLQHIPVKVFVGVVVLRVCRSDLPILVKSEDRQKASSKFKMVNRSLFPLQLSVKISGHDALSVSPQEINVGTEEETTLIVSFKPSITEEEPEIEGELTVTVEPEGMEMNLPVLAQSSSVLPVDTQPVEKSCPDATGESEKSLENQPRITKSLQLATCKSRLVFVSNPEKQRCCQKMTLRNGWTEDSLTLNLAIRGDEAFFFESEDDQKLRFRQIVIPPTQKARLVVCFEPSKTALYAANLVLKPRNLANPVRLDIALHGLGGCGQLAITPSKNSPKIQNDNGFSFGKIIPLNASFLYLSVKNTGTRCIFVKLRILPNELSDCPLSISDIFVQPCNFVLGLGESKEILVVNSGSPSTLRLAPGKVGVLETVYGDEILRQRLKGTKKCNVNWRNVNDVRLLKMNFEEYHLGEKSVFNESLWSPLREDALIFYNSCKISTIPLYCDIDPSSDASSTMWELTAHQETMTSFFNPTSSQIRRPLPFGKDPKSAPQRNTQSHREGVSSEFHIFPLDFRLKSSQQEPNILSIYNLSEENNIFEVEFDRRWLSVEPKAVTVEPRGSTSLKVYLNSQLPRDSKTFSTSIRVLGSNNEKVVRVEIEVDSSSIAVPKRFVDNPIPPKPPLDNAARKTKFRPKDTPTLEVPAKVDFVSTQVKSERCNKITVRNASKKICKLQVDCSCQHFYITRRYLNLEMKAEQKISLPIYFRPKKPGSHREIMVIRVLATEEEFRVELNGTGS